MSEFSRKITEATLHAYVDGVMEEERRAEVESHLDSNPADGGRVRAYQQQNEILREHARTFILNPLPTRLRRLVSRGGGFPIGRWAVAAMLLVVGGLGGWGFNLLMNPKIPPEMVLWNQARMAHVVFTPEVVHPVEVRADQEKHLVAWLSKRLGTPLVSPRLDKVGFVLVGGRLLSGNSGPAAQFMFEDASGMRLTLYVRTNPNQSGSMEFRYRRQGSVGVIYWLEGPVGYALSGELDRPKLRRVAEYINRQITRS